MNANEDIARVCGMKNTIVIKSAYFILLLAFIVVLLFSVFELNTLSNYKEKIGAIYSQSLNYSCNHWANQFYVANKELMRLVDSECKTVLDDIVNQPRASTTDSVTSLQNTLTNLSVIKDNEIVFFVYFTEHDLLISSVSYIAYFKDNELAELRSYLFSASPANTAEWNEVTLGETKYFLHRYTKNGLVSGCFISCENVLNNIVPDGQNIKANMLDMDGQLFFGDEVQPSGNQNYVYTRVIKNINKKIQVVIPYDSYVDNAPHSLALFVAAMTASLLLIALLYVYQKKTVYQPLMKLKDTMEAFSNGNLDMPLEGRQVNNEIGVLYSTFNHMREQIANLKIDVYETEIERQRVYTHFLRVQVQPHYYTNMLNVIYLLANAGDCKTICKMTKEMADYFRYILSTNQDLVLLKDELCCVEHHSCVQQIRYQDSFQMITDIHADPEKEYIPPLIVQTFVENSIKHNIMVVPELHIHLMVETKGNMLHIVVSDNGVGISPEIVQKLRNGEDIEENSQHIGMVNAFRRLRILYGGQASWQILSSSEGTCIILDIPRRGEAAAT